MRLIDADAVIDVYNRSSGTISDLMEIILDSPTVAPTCACPGKGTAWAELEQEIGGYMENKMVFRGKRLRMEEWERLDTGKWVYGVPLFDWTDCSLKCKNQHNGELLSFLGWNDDSHEYDHFDVDPVTVGLYTGLTDKNGAKIFTGDILRVGEYQFVVRFGRCGGVQNVKHEVGYLGFYVEPVGDKAKLFGLRTDILFWVNAEPVEVIGNVYDHSELADHPGHAWSAKEEP